MSQRRSPLGCSTSSLTISAPADRALLAESLDVVDVDVDHRRRVVGVPRIRVLPGRLSEHHRGAVETELDVQAAGPADRAQLLLEPERIGEELDRRLGVLVEEVRRDARHAATLPRCG